MFGGGSALDRGLDAFARRDWNRARRLLEQAMEHEERANGHYHLGQLYWRGLGGDKDVRAAVDCFARAAEMGHAAAQTAYGVALRAGVGVAADEAAAFEQFRAAAGAGDAEAMTQLALMSEPEDARRLLTRAADMGHGHAMSRMADLLMERRPVEALAWLYAAVALRADENARQRASLLAQELTAEQIARAQKTGRAYVKDIRDKARARSR